MAERTPTRITIGGKLPKSKIQRFLDAAEAGGAGTDYGGYNLTEDSLRAFQGSRVELMHDEARWGQFEALEELCEELGLPFVRTCDAKYEYDAEVVWWSPDTGHGSAIGNQNGEPMLRLVDVVKHLDDPAELRKLVAAATPIEVPLFEITERKKRS